MAERRRRSRRGAKRVRTRAACKGHPRAGWRDGSGLAAGNEDRDERGDTGQDREKQGEADDFPAGFARIGRGVDPLLPAERLAATAMVVTDLRSESGALLWGRKAVDGHGGIWGLA